MDRAKTPEARLGPRLALLEMPGHASLLRDWSAARLIRCQRMSLILDAIAIDLGCNHTLARSAAGSQSLDPRTGKVAEDFFAINLDPAMQRVGRLPELVGPHGDDQAVRNPPSAQHPAERHRPRQAFRREWKPACRPFDIGCFLLGKAEGAGSLLGSGRIQSKCGAPPRERDAADQ